MGAALTQGADDVTWGEGEGEALGVTGAEGEGPEAVLPLHAARAQTAASASAARFGLNLSRNPRGCDAES